MANVIVLGRASWRLANQWSIAMKFRPTPPEYMEKAMALTQEDAERLFARMPSRLSHKLEKEDIESLEAVALQLQFEDRQLKEWRNNLAKTRGKKTD
jgi:hypothetical protein